MANTDKPWKIVDLIKTTTDFFKQKNIENARLNAEVLLAHVLQKSRITLYVEFEQPVSSAELAKFREYVSRRSKKEPLQYITGSSEFMGLPFEVNPSVLIPRPETEILCEEVLKVRDLYNDQVNILDIGTGSGCIAISLGHLWPKAQLTAIDISTQALETAKRNSILNNVSNLHLFEQDIFNISSNSKLSGKFEIIISNPPYIAQHEMEALPGEVRDFEPRAALTDSKDGLSFYTHILNLVTDDYFSCDYLFFELSGSQPKKIVAEAKKCNFTTINVIHDLNGIERVLRIQI